MSSVTIPGRRVARGVLERGLRVWLRVAPPRVAARWSYNPLFDGDYYLKRYPDVALTHSDPWRHYRLHGVKEGRNPNQLFDTAWYRSTYPDVASSRLQPLDHYFLYGAREGRNPGPRFSTRYYLESNPDVRRAGLNPLHHYLRSGAREGRRPTAGGGNPMAIAGDQQGPPRRNLIKVIADGLQRRVMSSSIHRLSRTQPLALIIAGSYPRPDQDAGSLLLLNVMRLLRGAGFQTLFVPTNPRAASKEDRQYLKRLGVRVLPAMSRASIPSMLEMLGDRLDLAWLSRHDCGGVYIDEVRTFCPRAKVIFDPVDLHWLRQSREAAVAHDRIGMYQAMSVREREMYLVRMADISIVVSEAEEELVRATVPGANVAWLPFPHDVPGRSSGFDPRSGVAFVGNYLHRPNVDAVTQFLDHVWPLVLRTLPTLTFYVVGPELPASIIDRHDPGLCVVGHVDDLSAWLNQVRLTVAPLRFGAGAKGKVITSLANGVPCVATSIAAEGLALSDDAIAVADEPKEQAAAIVRLHEDRTAWLAMSDAAIAWAESTHSMQAAHVRLTAILESLDAPSAARYERAA